VPNSVRIGFIGTGLIGAPMVERLLECGRTVIVWNRSPEKVAPLVQAGAIAATSAREVVVASSLICLCLTDTAAVDDVLFGAQGIADALGAGHLVIDLSSIDPSATVRMAQRLRAGGGAHWLDAPVSGGVSGARAGRLIVFVGGEAEDIPRAAPVFDALAQRVTHMGAQGSGQITKSCNQQIVACNLMVIAEMIAFAERAGIDTSRLPAALAGGFADSLPLQLFGPRMAAHVDTPRLGAVSTFRKDIEQVVRLIHERDGTAPVTAAALGRYREAMAHADVGGEGDVSRLIRLFGP
jgi:3-hydroxyisobutyrate dehydrogenase